MLAEVRSSIHMVCGVGLSIPFLTAWWGGPGLGSGLPEGSLIVSFHAVGISSRVYLGYGLPGRSEILTLGWWDLDFGIEHTGSRNKGHWTWPVPRRAQPSIDGVQRRG